MKISKFYTKLYNKLLNIDDSTYLKRKAAMLLSMIRQYKISHVVEFDKMPLVETFVDGKKIIVPLAHDLAFYKKRFPDYDRHIVSVCRYLKSQKKFLNFIDVGANVGDTVINIDIAEKAKYLLIEGGGYYFELLKKNLERYSYQYKAVQCILSDKSSEEDYQLEYKNSSARLVRGKSQHSEQMVQTLDEIVEREEFEPNILKIDTDGFDFRIMRGSFQILKKYKPVIFFEWWGTRLIENAEEPISIFGFLHDLGYEKCLIYDNFGSALSVINTNDKINLEILKNYSCDRRTPIYYFDVLLFHKEDKLNILDFMESCRNE